MAETNQNSEGRAGAQLEALDGVRGLAILLVMLHHFTQLIPAGGAVVSGVRTFLYYGWCGVDLFFALSGFLITRILLDTARSSNYFSGFYARRVLRIFPLYYLVLTYILLLAYVVTPLSAVTPLPADRKLYFVYLTNWLVLWKGTWRANILGHFWSLAVEEQFYLVWPLCVFVLSRRNLARLAVILSGIALLIRIYWIESNGPSQAVVMATVTRMDSLLLGGLAAVLYLDQRVFGFRRSLGWAALLAILVFSVGVLRYGNNIESAAIFFERSGFTILAIGFSALILYLASTDQSQTFIQLAFRFTPLRNLGKYSYGVYVYHVPTLFFYAAFIHALLPRRLLESQLVAFFNIVALMVINYKFAKLSYNAYESRFLRLKSRFAPRYATLCAEKLVPSAPLQPVGVLDEKH